MAWTDGQKTSAVGTVGSAAASMISAWGAYKANSIAVKSANKVSAINAKSATELAIINNARINERTSLDLYFQAEEYESARREVLDKRIEVQTAILQAKGSASAQAAFTGIHGNTSEIEENLIDIKSAEAERDVEYEIASLTRQNALSVGTTLLNASATKQSAVFTPTKQIGPSKGLAIGGVAADLSAIGRDLQKNWSE